MGGHDLNNWHRLRIVVAQYRHRELSAFHIGLYKDLSINLEDFLKGIFHRFRAFHNEYAQGASLVCGLNHAVIAHLSHQFLARHALALTKNLGNRGGNAVVLIKDLGLRLIDSRCARPHTGTDVGNAQKL